jgi:hypothetical protein
MPILNPITGTLQFLINDLVNEVLLRCENRTTDSSRAAIWLRDALIEISSNPDYRDDFQELEEWGPQVSLTASGPSIGVFQEYPESTFITSGDVSNAVLSMLIWVDYPFNQNRRKLDVSHYQKTDKFQPVFSLPTEWYRFGGNIGFNPVPDKPYLTQLRISKAHPINDNLLSQTVILLPREWNEVLILAAVQRGFIELMEYEKASAVHQQLYGDPDNKAQPGLIFHVKRKRRKEQWRQESRLTFTRRPYNWGHP